MPPATRARPARMLIVILLAVLLLTPACGDAGTTAPSSAPAEAPAEADNGCGAAVDLARVIGDGPDIPSEPPPTPQQVAAAFAEYRARLEPPLTELERRPPPGRQEDIATLARQARYAIDQRDPAAVETPEFEGAASRLTTYLVGSCGYPVLRVVATDYTFQGIPPNTGAGTTVIALINEGAERHQLILYRISETVPQPMAELIRLPEAQQDAALERIADANAGPGSSSTEYVSLIPGRYGVACRQPRGSVPPQQGTGPPHSELGMVAEFTVT